MSRIGKKQINIPDSIRLSIEGRVVKVVGPKGENMLEIPKELAVREEGGSLQVTRNLKTNFSRALWGTYRSLIENMIEGVLNGYKKTLVLVGVGYRASKGGENVSLSVGYSHPVVIKPPEGITLEVEGNNKIIVSGIDKCKVGQVAALIRRVRPPEPYKGKGIRYENEVVRIKHGKAGKVGTGAG